jgi:hypothetical protein
MQADRNSEEECTMAGSHTASKVEGDARMSVVAAGFLGGAYGDLERAVSVPDPLGSHDTVRTLLSAVEGMRESLKLVGPLYGTTDRKAWARRFRTLGLDLRPLRDSDRVIEGLRATAATVGDGGQRAVAFLIGHYMVVSDLQAAYAASRLERFDVIGKERAFAKFASAPKGGADGKARLRAFAAVTLTERMDALESWIEAAATVDDRDAWRAVQLACRKVLIAIEVCAGCYELKTLEAARSQLNAVGDAAAAIRNVDAVLDVVADPEMTTRTRVGGVSAKDLAELAKALRSLRRRSVTEARKVLSLSDSVDRKALVLAPVVPGFSVMVTAQAPVPAAKPEVAVATPAPKPALAPAPAAAAKKATPKPAPKPVRSRRAAAPKPPATES